MAMRWAPVLMVHQAITKSGFPGASSVWTTSFFLGYWSPRYQFGEPSFRLFPPLMFYAPGSSIETQEELRHIFYSSFKSCSSRGYITKWQLRAKTFLNNVGISFATWMFTPLKLLFSAWCLQIPIGCGRVFSFELVSTSGEVNVYPNTDFCPSLGKVFLSRFLLLKSGQGACPPFCRTFFLWKGHISVSDQGVCLPLGKAGPSLEQQEATRWGHTHIHQPSKATQ